MFAVVLRVQVVVHPAIQCTVSQVCHESISSFSGLRIIVQQQMAAVLHLKFLPKTSADLAPLRSAHLPRSAIAQVGTRSGSAPVPGLHRAGRTAQVGIAAVLAPRRSASLQVGTARRRTAQVGIAQVGTAQVGTAQVGTAQVRHRQWSAPLRLRTAQVGTAQADRPGRHRAGRYRSGWHRAVLASSRLWHRALIPPGRHSRRLARQVGRISIALQNGLFNRIGRGACTTFHL